MKLVQKTLLWSLVTLFSLSLTGIVNAKEITLGVNAPRSVFKVLKQWEALGKYIEAETGHKVRIIPLTPSKTIRAVESGKVDFILANPVLAVMVIEKHKFKPLLTRITNFGPKLGGVIFSLKKSGIKTATDLKGKDVMAYKFKRSAAAYVFQVKHLKNKGIYVYKDFKSFRQASKQDDIVYAVSRGFVDAGFVKMGLLESMAREGKIKMSEFQIIDQVKDDIAAVHSTKLYPQWTLSVRPGYNRRITMVVKDALLGLKPGHPAARKANIKGFVNAVSLEDLKATLKSLNLPPYGS